MALPAQNPDSTVAANSQSSPSADIALRADETDTSNWREQFNALEIQRDEALRLAIEKTEQGRVRQIVALSMPWLRALVRLMNADRLLSFFARERP